MEIERWYELRSEHFEYLIFDENNARQILKVFQQNSKKYQLGNSLDVFGS